MWSFSEQLVSKASVVAVRSPWEPVFFLKSHQLCASLFSVLIISKDVHFHRLASQSEVN